MNRRRVILGLVVLLVLSPVVWVLVDEHESQARRAVLMRLWERPGCGDLALIAIEAREQLARERRGSGPAALAAWDDWPPDLQQRSLLKGLRRAGAETVDGVVITKFVTPDQPEATWFYVVPQSPGQEQPWFRIIAMDADYCLYTPLPLDRWPVIEKRSEHPAEPIQAVQRICAPRKP